MGIIGSSEDKSEIIHFGIFLEGKKDESYVAATDGVTFEREENECPEVIAWVPISTYQLANILQFI